MAPTTGEGNIATQLVDGSLDWKGSGDSILD